MCVCVSETYGFMYVCKRQYFHQSIQYIPKLILAASLFPGDMLGGHLDDMEKDWSKPIVSMRYMLFRFILLINLFFKISTLLFA